MKKRSNSPMAHPASAAERASIRALKHWLMAGPSESPLQDQIVRLRIAAAIAQFAPGKPGRMAKHSIRHSSKA